MATDLLVDESKSKTSETSNTPETEAATGIWPLVDPLETIELKVSASQSRDCERFFVHISIANRKKRSGVLPSLFWFQKCHLFRFVPLILPPDVSRWFRCSS